MKLNKKLMRKMILQEMKKMQLEQLDIPTMELADVNLTLDVIADKYIAEINNTVSPVDPLEFMERLSDDNARVYTGAFTTTGDDTYRLEVIITKFE